MVETDSSLAAGQGGGWLAYADGRLRWNGMAVRCINQRPVILPGFRT